jgi:Flp pilus assembly protein TadB
VLRDKLSALTAQGRTQGWVAIAMPMAMVAAMTFVTPGYLSPLYETRLGWLVFALSGGMLTVGGIWIAKICQGDALL